MQTVDNISTAWMRADEQASFESGKTYQIQNAGVNEVILREGRGKSRHYTVPGHVCRLQPGG